MMDDQRLELLAELLGEEGIGGEVHATVPRRKNLKEFPLSYNQQRLWLLDKLENGIHYNDHFHLRLSGPLNVPALERSIEDILRRHEVMRSVFSEVDGAPFQTLLPPETVSLPLIDIRHFPEDVRITEAARLAIEESRKPFHLDQGPLWRFALIRIAGDDHVLLITAHHIAIDGWSRGVFLRELGMLYPAYLRRALSPLKDLPLQYADYAAWQAEWVESGQVRRQLDYWKRELAGASTFLPVRTDRPRPPKQSFRGARHRFDLRETTTAALKDLCRREHVSPFMSLLAVLQVLLHRYTGQDDILVWTPAANRTKKELEGMIGYFLNLLALRGMFSKDATFREILRRARETTLGGLANQDVPLEKLIDVLQPRRSVRQPLFQVLFAFHNVPMPVVDMAGIRLHEFEIDIGKANFELTVSLTETSSGIGGHIEYATDLFDRERIVRMADHFQMLLDLVCADPEKRLADLPLLVPVEHNETGAQMRTDVDCADRTSAHVEDPAEPLVSPRDVLEQQLVKVWENVLRVHPVGMNDNFFDLGGHSLVAVRLFSEIRKQTGRHLPLATLFQAPTVKQLAEILRKDGWTPHWSSLAPIQPGGAKQPFYCVHGGGGNILLFRDLANRLGSEYPFFGLQSQGLDGKGNYLTTVEEMAAQYLKEIREFQPRGPYFLGGFCMGGAVAYHMAQMLLEQGEQTPLLVLFDTYNYDGVPLSISVGAKARRLRDRTYFHWKNMTRLRPKERLAYLNDKFKEARRRNLEKLSTQFAPVVNRLGLRQDRPGSAVFVEDVNDHAGFSYRPAPYPAKLTLFQPQSNYYALQKPCMGWKELATGGINVVAIPVYPGGMFVEPYVRIVADKLRECIDAASGGLRRL
jgi:thioesterase domain-containing protein/acyl carrier protein